MSEHHLVNRIGWIRAAVLGANDGILSTASTLSGVAAGGASHNIILLTGLAALAAGATAMATGEYVSVSSQSDIERSDLAREQHELTHNTKFEREELAQIYVARGLQPELAKEVAKQLMKHDALGAHARDELGISDLSTARPVQAALTSAASFTCGAILPLLVAAFVQTDKVVPAIIVTAMISLAMLGALGARTGGVAILRPMLRVLLWGALSLGVTTLTGFLFWLGKGDLRGLGW